MQPSRLLIASGLSVLLGSCGVDADPTTATFAQKVQAAQRRMHERYAAVQRIQYGIVRSDLAQIHEEAHAIASLDEPDVLPTWRPYFEEVRLAAQQVELADDVGTAARMTAQLGRRCARCHQAIQVTPTFRSEPRPDDSSRLGTTMAGHQWAAARLWEGLIGPSDERWRVGAEAMAQAPLTIVAEESSLGIADDVSRVRLLAKRALVPQSQDARASLLGDVLATCAHCHLVIRDR